VSLGKTLGNLRCVTCTLQWHSRESTGVMSLSWYGLDYSLSLPPELQLEDGELVLPLVVIYLMATECDPYIHPMFVC
jgi:hypothetical protein